MSGNVTVEPLGVTIAVDDNETLMAAAQRAGLYWPTVCKGNAQCNRCVLTIIDGEGLAPMLATELNGLRAVRWHGDVDLENDRERLACQVRVTGDAVVEKRGVKLLT